MKKIFKFSKIILLITMVFSYISSPISVLAEEAITSGLKPLVLNFASDDNGEEYTLNYISVNPSDYEDTKNYKIALETTITYTNGDEYTKQKEINVLGAVLNSNTGGNSIVSELIDKYYNADYVIEVSVYDETNELLYSEELEYETNYSFGLTGKLNEETAGELLPVSELVGETTVGNYDVTNGIYTQKMSILPGELSPVAEYRVVYHSNDVITYSEVMTAGELALLVFDGTSTDLTDKLAGKYSYTDGVTIEEVSGNATDGYEVKETYTYNYDASLNYGTDNDEFFSNLYEIKFEDGYMIVNAKDLYETESVITIGEILDALSNNAITLKVQDRDGNILDLTDEEVLISEVENNYVLEFTNGASASYEVVVMGDTNYDNQFTNEDLVGVINGYIDEENILSMDMWSSNEFNIPEEFGTITFEDVIITNELSKEDMNLDREEVDNESLILEFEDLSSEVFVGDTVELQVLLNKAELEEITDTEVILDTQEATIDEENSDIEDEEEVEEFIDGIDANIKLSDNLKIKDVKFNEFFTGSYNEKGRVVAVGDALNEENIIMTLVLEVISLGEGTGSVELGGCISKFLNIHEFETITTEFEVIRRLSTNNNLSSLTASVGTFDVAFDKDVTVYTLIVPHDAESVILSGSLEELNSEVDGLIEYQLVEDRTTAIITVTAEDGSTKVYTVYIIKDSAPVVVTPIVYYYSSNNYLKSLEVSGYDIEFDKYTEKYNITIKNGINSLDIIALAEDSDARVEITGNSDFKEGENIVVITVTAENGSTREYKLVVTMEEKRDVATSENSSNTAEKVVIIILIILVVLGLLYLIFKKDEEETEENRVSNKNDSKKANSDNSSSKTAIKKKK